MELTRNFFHKKIITMNIPIYFSKLNPFFYLVILDSFLASIYKNVKIYINRKSGL